MQIDPMYDVVQIGYGPVGQACAALLGRAGFRVAVIERHEGLYPLPRAGHIDHEIARVFQGLGAAERIMVDAFRCANYGWRNQHGESLLDIDWSREGISGWASDYLLYQPYLEDALDAAARRYPEVMIHQGWEAVGITAHADHVKVTVAPAGPNTPTQNGHADKERLFSARFVIGVDGANSFTRSAAGIELQDFGFRENWLVVDFRQKRPLSFAFDNGQICDPARPLCLFQLGKTHRRFEFMVLPGEDAEALSRPERVWALVSAWLSPDDAELIRSTVYTFRSANARAWRSGRIILAGDAAHLMPPFLGQGMCSGIRDVVNLTWKLDLIRRGLAADSLLDTYEVERKAHVGAIIEQAVALGKISCMVDPVAAQERDAALMSGQVPPPPPFPWIYSGLLQKSLPNKAGDIVGRLGPQAVIEHRGVKGRADDVLGGGWHFIYTSTTVWTDNTVTSAIIRELEIRLLHINGTGADGVKDDDGVYARYLCEARIDALLVRPDFYVFGVVALGESADPLFAELAAQLGLRLTPSRAVTETGT